MKKSIIVYFILIIIFLQNIIKKKSQKKLLQEKYFVLILWNPTIFQADKILKEIPNIIDKKNITVSKENLNRYIFDIYKLDKRCSHDIVLPPKIEKLKQYNDNHLIVKFKINNPSYTNDICDQAIKLKEMIREKYKLNVQNYIRDIIIHVADNFEQSEYIWRENTYSKIKKKKIAICLSGHLRVFKKTYKKFYENIVNVLEAKFEVDIFMFIWNYENKIDIEEALEIYKPIKYIIKKDFEFKLPSFCENMKFYKGSVDDVTLYFGNHIKQKYGIYECFGLIDKNDYDYVIRNRYDNYFQEKIDINSFGNNLYIPPGHYFYLNGKPTNLNDSFAYGPYKEMEKYSDFVNIYKDILLQIKNKKLSKDYNYLYNAIAVTLLYKYYISGIKNIKYIETKTSPALLREDGTLIYFSNNQIYGYSGNEYKITNHLINNLKINTHKECYNYILDLFNKKNIKFVIIRGFKYLPIKPDTDLDIVIHPESYDTFVDIYKELYYMNLIRFEVPVKYIQNDKCFFYTPLFTERHLKEDKHLPGNYYRFDTYSDIFFYKDGEGCSNNAIVLNSLFKKYLFDNIIKIDNYYIPDTISEIILLIYRNLYDKKKIWSIKHKNRINDIIDNIDENKFLNISQYLWIKPENVLESLKKKEFENIDFPDQKLMLFIIRKKGMEKETIEYIINEIENEYQILDKILININNKKKFYSNFYNNYETHKDNIDKANDNQCLAIITNNREDKNPHEIKTKIRNQYTIFYPPIGNIIHCSDSSEDCEEELKLLLNENIDNFKNIGTYYSQKDI
jgi:nucleoside diphosphate kinase